MGSHRCSSRPRVDCARGECARGPHSIVTEGVVGGVEGGGGARENRLPMVIVTRVRAATGPYIILLSHRGQQ